MPDPADMMIAAMSRRIQISFAFTCVYLVWGSAYIAIRYVAQLVHPFLISGLRYLLASGLLMAYLLVRGRPLRLPRGQLVRIIGLGFIMFSVNTSLINYGSRVLSAGVTALFLSTIPIFIGLIEAFVSKGADISPTKFTGTLTGFAGLILLMGRELRGEPITSVTGLACLAIIAAALAWASGSFISKRMMLDASPLLLVCWQMLSAGCINTGIGIAVGGLRSSHWTGGAWIAILYLAVFGSLISYTSYLFLLRSVRISSVATYAYVNPIVAIVLGRLVLGEKFHGTEWIALGIVLASVAVVVNARSVDLPPVATGLRAEVFSDS